MEASPIENKRENNRSFNLVWIIILLILLVSGFFSTKDLASYLPFGLVAVLVFIFETLAILIPRRNNLVSVFFLLIFALFSNIALARFYNLTWLFSPALDNIVEDPTKVVREVSAFTWGISLITVVTFLYMFFSSLGRLFVKKSKPFLCSLIAVVVALISSYICFYAFPQTFQISNATVKEGLIQDIDIKLKGKGDTGDAPELSSMKSSEEFFVSVSGLPKGKRYGLRILNNQGDVVNKESKFEYCWKEDCLFLFGALNTISNRWEPGKYVIEIMFQERNTLVLLASRDVEIEELIISPYDKTKEYPCRIWLTLGDSDEKLLRITVDSQVMTDITVMVQCRGEGTYNGQLAVGNIGNGTDYSNVTIYPGEPMSIQGLGGNVAHGYVRLIINNEIVGEAIIDRGFGF